MPNHETQPHMNTTNQPNAHFATEKRLESQNTEIEPPAPSINKMFHELVGCEEGLEYCSDIDFFEKSRITYLGDEIKTRRGIHVSLIDKEDEGYARRGSNPLVSANYVSQVAMERYFNLLEIGREGISGVFKLSEIICMLDYMADPIWEYIPRPNPYIAKKISKLSPLEKIALMDLCESVWRNPYIESWESAINMLGVELHQEPDESSLSH